MVNQPDFTLKVMHNGSQVWTTRVVIGKPDMATPLLSETMKYITINPTWNVPPSIVHNEYLPALAQDPTVLARMGLKVVNNRDGSVHIYQPPGEANALGRIRFNFPNRFLVYQHDTPDKHFSRMMRAPTATAACACRIRRNTPRCCSTSRVRARTGPRTRCKRMFGTGEQDIQLPDADLGPPDLSDRVRRRRRQAADPPRRLQPRQPHDGGDQERARRWSSRCRSASASKRWQRRAQRRADARRRARSSFFEAVRVGAGFGSGRRRARRGRRAIQRPRCRIDARGINEPRVSAASSSPARCCVNEFFAM